MINKILDKGKIYIRTPITKAVNYFPYEYRLGRKFWNTYNFLNFSQWWTKQQHNTYQFQQLKKILIYSYENVPYYTDTFNSFKFNPYNMSNMKDIEILPFLTKDLIRTNQDKLISKKFNIKNIRKSSSGGTTGLPISFYEEKNSHLTEWAFIYNIWQAVGFKTNTRKKMVILRGVEIDKYYEYKGLNLILSSFKLTKTNSEDYVTKINSFNANFIQAYPSSIYILADFILKNKYTVNTQNLKGIICGSEKLYKHQKETIEKAFNNVRVYSFYGHSEKSCLASQCEISDNYHVKSEYGYSEIINTLGNSVHNEGGIGEIVCTGFNNYVNPFIRYKTDDLVVNSNKVCLCKRNYKLISNIKGRVQDFFVDKNNNFITFIMQDKPLYNVTDKIFAYQYVQEKPGYVILKLESKSTISDIDLQNIKKDFYAVYNNINLEIEFANRIERTKSGKFKFLVQKIN